MGSANSGARRMRFCVTGFDNPLRHCSVDRSDFLDQASWEQFNQQEFILLRFLDSGVPKTPFPLVSPIDIVDLVLTTCRILEPRTSISAGKTRANTLPSRRSQRVLKSAYK